MQLRMFPGEVDWSLECLARRTQFGLGMLLAGFVMVACWLRSLVCEAVMGRVMMMMMIMMMCRLGSVVEEARISFEGLQGVAQD